jgi:hypothetical protein
MAVHIGVLISACDASHMQPPPAVAAAGSQVRPVSSAGRSPFLRGPVATGGCGLETSIWPLRILLGGYGTWVLSDSDWGGPTQKKRSGVPI